MAITIGTSLSNEVFINSSLIEKKKSNSFNKTAKKVYKPITDLFLKRILPIASFVIFPGTFFISSVGGVLYPHPEKMQKSLGRISKLWEKNSILLCLAAVPLYLYVCPWTPLATAMLFGLHYGSKAALNIDKKR